LYVTDSLGVTFTTSETVAVGPSLYVSIIANRTAVDIAGSIAFTPSVTEVSTAVNYSWTFGDGGVASTATSPSHSFASEGVFDVVVIVRDLLGGSAEATVTVTVNPALGGVASASPASGTARVSETFTATATGGTAPFDFAWVFGDGTAGTGASVAHAYRSEGTYNATVWINDSGGGTFSQTVTVSVASAGSTLGLGTGAILYLLVGSVVLVGAVAAVWVVRRRSRPKSGGPSRPPNAEDR
jgi:PKD repeat protein